jgi:hypothetical protein
VGLAVLRARSHVLLFELLVLRLSLSGRFCRWRRRRRLLFLCEHHNADREEKKSE